MKRENILSALALSALLAACSEAIPSGDPAEQLNREMTGWEAPIGVMMGVDERPYWAEAAVAGFRAANSDDRPAEIKTVSSNGCRFTKPGPDEILAKVHVAGSMMDSSVFSISRKDIGERTKDFIAAYQKSGRSAASFYNKGVDLMNVIDVVVTETSKPVYLVLSYSFATIFNVQLAEGARISRVALVVFGKGGVANVDALVPVSALYGLEMRKCGVTPIRQPADHWNFVRNAKKDPSLKGELARTVSFFHKFAGWYRQNFGVASEPGAIGATTASHVLVGPLPETLEARVPFKSLEGSTVRMTPNDYIMVGTLSDYKKKHEALVLAAAATIGGPEFAKLAAGE